MALTSEVFGEQGYLVGGERHFGDETFAVENPGTEEEIATVADAGSAGVEEAIQAAQEAQVTWAEMDEVERGQLLDDLAELIREEAERIAEVETKETGRPYSSSLGQVKAASHYIEYFAGITDKIEGKQIPIPGEEHRLDYTVREPYGVTAHIVPWNASFVLAARSFGPALAAGNAIVAKAPSLAPLSLLEFGELAEEAGLPTGLLNVLTGSGSNVGTPLISDHRVQAVEFTGSTWTGKQVMKTAADHVIPVHLELGGKGANIIFDDADIEGAVQSVIDTFANAGQICYAPTRVFVQEGVYDEVTSQAADKAAGMALGPGMDDPDMGPLISADAQDTVAGYVDDAVANGATVLTGGEKPQGTGHFYRPTLIEGVADDDAIACDEVFGPVFTFHTFQDASNVIERANDTRFGLNNLVWTSDLSRAHRVAGELESGTVMVNDYPILSPAAVSGGYKESGLGRGKGTQAIKSFTQTKNVVISLDEL